MSSECKWKVLDNTYNYVVLINTHINKLLCIKSKEFYDNRNLPSKRILLKLTNDEYKKLISYSSPLYEEYYKELTNYSINRNTNILYGFINEALS